MDQSSQKINIVVLNCSYNVSVVASETAGKNGDFFRSEELNFVFLGQKLGLWVPFSSFELGWLLWRLLWFGRNNFDRLRLRAIRQLFHFSLNDLIRSSLKRGGSLFTDLRLFRFFVIREHLLCIFLNPSSSLPASRSREFQPVWHASLHQDRRSLHSDNLLGYLLHIFLRPSLYLLVALPRGFTGQGILFGFDLGVYFVSDALEGVLEQLQHLHDRRFAEVDIRRLALRLSLLNDAHDLVHVDFLLVTQAELDRNLVGGLDWDISLDFYFFEFGCLVSGYLKLKSLR